MSEPTPGQIALIAGGNEPKIIGKSARVIGSAGCGRFHVVLIASSQRKIVHGDHLLPFGCGGLPALSVADAIIRKAQKK